MLIIRQEKHFTWAKNLGLKLEIERPAGEHEEKLDLEEKIDNVDCSHGTEANDVIVTDYEHSCQA